MNKTKKTLSIVTVLTLFLLFSISPVLAEEATEAIDVSTGTENAIVEAVVDIPDADEEIVETVVDIPNTDEAVVETVIDLPNTDEAVTEVIEESPVTAEEPEYLDSDVLNVIVPITVSVTIDPLELAGKGQVYSSIYKIKNYGDTDVLLTFTDIQVTFADDTSFAASAHPFVERIGSNLKAIYMKLDFGREDVPPAVITDPDQKKEISIPLSTTQGDMSENSLVQFNFSGNVNEASALNWHDNDVKISLNYTLEAVLPPVEVDIPLTTEPAIEIPVTEDATPGNGEATPSVEDIPPPVEDVPPPAEDIPPPVEDVPPPAEDIPPPVEDAPPPAEDTPPPAEDAPPPAEEPSI